MKLYSDLAEWWPLMSPPGDYIDDAEALAPLLSPLRKAGRPRLLELGSGGGHLASLLSARFDITLVDLSPQMLDVSRRLNPDCRHLEGDMRSVRLGDLFDAVLIHDAVSHLTNADDLQAGIETARAHLSVGGIAVFCPDATIECFHPGLVSGGTDGAGRSMRYLEWTHPEVRGCLYTADIAYLLRDADGNARVEHDRMEMGIFSRADWKQALIRGGFEAPDILPVSGRDVLRAVART